MTKPIQISLRAGERLYVNGAVLRMGRKVTLELMNDVTFLLESHVMQVEDTTTPLRQLYFVVQTMLIDPRNADAARGLFATLHAGMVDTASNEELLAGLAEVEAQVEARRPFDALRAIRRLFPVEDAILGRESNARGLRATGSGRFAGVAAGAAA